MGPASTKVKPLKIALSHALPFPGCLRKEAPVFWCRTLIPSIPTKVHTPIHHVPSEDDSLLLGLWSCLSTPRMH